MCQVRGRLSSVLPARQRLRVWSGLAGNAGDSLQLREVLAAATAPYFSMLEAWLWQGRINDPQNDFMVQQQVRARAGLSCMQLFRTWLHACRNVCFHATFQPAVQP